MSIKRTKIDEAAEAIRTAQDALKAAVDNHVQAINTEAHRLVSERMRKDEKRDKVRANLNRISATKQSLEADEERYFALYQRADYRGDEAEAENARAAGDLARTQLEKIRADEDKARAALEAASFNVDEADSALRHDLTALRTLILDEGRDEAEQGITAAYNPIRRAVAERDEARNQREHRRRVEANQRYANQHRHPSGTIHVTNSQGR